MIKIQFIGNVGTDATLKQLDNSNVINFTVAVNESYKNKDGVKQTVTKWIDCEVWNRPKLQAFIKKGGMLFINGNPEVREYIPKDGQEPKAVQICKVDEIQFLSKKEGEAEPNE